MLTGLWNSLAGYVIIELEGKALERLLNRLVHSGIEIWHIRRTGTDTITAYISVEGFYALRSMLHGQKIKVRILQKKGLIMRLSALRFRKVLLYGWVITMALLIAASRRIWFIEITGLDTVKPQDVLSVLEQNGIREGAWRSAVHTSPLGNTIMAADPRIAWAGAVLEGVTLKVEVLEAGDPAAVPDENAVPAGIFATADGIVTSVTVLEGKALVREGDAVNAGQELITGVLKSDETNVILTHARGTVLAKVIRRATASAGPALLRSVPEGEPVHKTRISLLGKSIVSGDHTEEAQKKTLFRGGLRNCLLPLTVEKIAAYPLVMKEIAADEAALREESLRAAEARMVSVLPDGARILSKESQTKLREDGSMEAVITVITEENIGITKEIDASYGKQPQ
ncbi:MAG: hypothetical protein E7330_05500 [Clostridiales bacterium]|nr:hypothetical protein [Clostridiales bacterium]